MPKVARINVESIKTQSDPLSGADQKIQSQRRADKSGERNANAYRNFSLKKEKKTYLQPPLCHIHFRDTRKRSTGNRVFREVIS